MFSGIVEEVAKVVAVDTSGAGSKLAIESSLDHALTKAGDSLCIDGVCLTVTALKAPRLEFDLSEETGRRSTLINLSAGAKVNLERALKLGERLHGHLVFGHIDTTVKLLARSEEKGSWRLAFERPVELQGYIAPKGSLALAGVSLTVGEVEADRFSVYIVPQTAARTNLLEVALGRKVNLEVDMLARYVHSLLGGEQGEARLLKALTENGLLSYKFQWPQP